MDSIWFITYVVLKLDALINFIKFFMAAGYTLFIFLFISSFVSRDAGEEELYRSMIKWAKVSLLISLFFHVMVTLLPSTREALVIIGAESLWQYREEIFKFITQYLTK